MSYTLFLNNGTYSTRFVHFPTHPPCLWSQLLLPSGQPLLPRRLLALLRITAAVGAMGDARWWRLRHLRTLWAIFSGQLRALVWERATAEPSAITQPDLTRHGQILWVYIRACGYRCRSGFCSPAPCPFEPLSWPTTFQLSLSRWW